MNEGKARFKIKVGEFEFELEGEESYVKSKLEELLKVIPLEKFLKNEKETSSLKFNLKDLEGVAEYTPEGKLYLTVPADSLTSKEALGIILYAVYPNRLSDEELSEMLSLSWKPIRKEAVRARASELKREGKIIAIEGKYGLSGAGFQWIKNEVLTKLKH
ncbi:MAG: hypothetical protein QXR82_00645 [Candidatus Bathyarchaeia archaeon]|nr:hypothetical protein [Candidatus Bathyarchaeota archaeon]